LNLGSLFYGSEFKQQVDKLHAKYCQILDVQILQPLGANQELRRVELYESSKAPYTSNWYIHPMWPNKLMAVVSKTELDSNRRRFTGLGNIERFLRFTHLASMNHENLTAADVEKQLVSQNSNILSEINSPSFVVHLTFNDIKNWQIIEVGDDEIWKIGHKQHLGNKNS
jgi:translation elongation factor EF-Ts